MATSDRLTENYLTCTICYDVFTNPATLQCDHTFCRQCLLKYAKTQHKAVKAKTLPCPCCTQLTRVVSPGLSVEEWINRMKPSHLILGLMDDFGPASKTTGMFLTRTLQEHFIYTGVKKYSSTLGRVPSYYYNVYLLYFV